MASVTISGVQKSYGNTQVLHGIDLDIQDGEFVVLVGPSGCGKSTLLRMVAGLEEISAGDVHIGGQRVNDLPPKDRDIAMVFQSYALYPHMTVQQNLSFALELRKMDAAEVQRRTQLAADILGLKPLMARFPKQLSGGQRQRVAMGRAIVREPKAFLFDEPLSNLDAQLRVSMRAEIKALQLRLKTTSIYVTHDQVEAMTMADRIVVMREGRIEQQGAPLELYDDPNNRFVAGFIGSPSMNFVRTTVIDGYIDMGLSGRIPLPANMGFVQGDVEVGIRPEHLVIDHQGPLAARVQVVEPTGSETLLYVECNRQRLCVMLRGRAHCRVGETIRIGLTSSILVFDPSTGKRIRAQIKGL
jgi:multiple sugar transport system ATP-binding protein